MTSKISFSKLVRDEMRKLNWLLALQSLIFFLLIPFRVLLVLANARSSGYLSRNSTASMLGIFCEHAGLGRIENTVIILGVGIICGIAAFSYVYSSVQLDFYHSLALRREKLFAAKYLGGFLVFAIPYIITQILAVLAGLCYGAFSSKVTIEILLAAIQGILFFLCSYSGTLIAVMLTGKLLTTVLALGVLGCYVPMLSLVYTGYREVFFYTCVSDGLIDKYVSAVLQYSSPWTFCMHEHICAASGETIKGATGGWPTAGSLLLVLAVAAVLTAISLFIYRMRSTEAAGKALAFKRLEAAVKLLLSIPTAAVAPLFAYELLDSMLWEAVFTLLFGALACMIIEFIYRWDIRQVLCHKLHIVITVAAALVIFFFCRMDMIGYNTYLPQRDDISSMAAAATDMRHLYFDEDGLAYSTYSGIQKDILDRLETEDLEAYYRLAENSVDKVKAGEGNVFDGTTVSVSVKYSLKNGREVYREYMADEELLLDTFDDMQKNPEFVENFYPIMTWTRENIAALGEVTFYTDETIEGGTADFTDLMENQTEEDYNGNVELAEVEDGKLYSVPDDDIERLVEAYRKDLLAVSFRDAWYEGQLCVLNFDLPARGSGGGEGYLVDTYYINEKFTNTWKVLSDVIKNEKPSGTIRG